MNKYYFTHNPQTGVYKLIDEQDFLLRQDELRFIECYEAETFADAANAMNQFTRNHEIRMRGAA